MLSLPGAPPEAFGNKSLRRKKMAERDHTMEIWSATFPNASFIKIVRSSWPFIFQFQKKFFPKFSFLNLIHLLNWYLDQIRLADMRFGI